MQMSKLCLHTIYTGNHMGRIVHTGINSNYSSRATSPCLLAQSTWWRRELLAWQSGVTAAGISPWILGSSGILDRNLSSLSLKSSGPQFLESLIHFGILLKRAGPDTWKLASLCLLIFVFSLGIKHCLPLTSELTSFIPQLGTRFSRIFQV